jgi:diadenosine tetraphosphatase ApaH/serine/threonine PP2A family protein phosphatase
MDGFQLIKRLKKEDAFLVHGTPREPEEWHYLITMGQAEENFSYFGEKLCFVGHSHLPFIVEKKAAGDLVSHKDEAPIVPESRYIINVGSVGQPRDGDPRACYLLMDAGRALLVRVEYDIQRVQEKMASVGLPRPLIERLSRGR